MRDRHAAARPPGRTSEETGMTKRYFEDFRVGEVVELGSRGISEQEIVAFAREFDPQPFHIDPVRARDSVFSLTPSNSASEASVRPIRSFRASADCTARPSRMGRMVV